MRRIGDKKGVSPVVATVLLIAIVIIIAIIIFLWAKAFVSERAQKFNRAIELSCDDVNFEAGVFDRNPDPLIEDYVLDIVNRGNVPIYGFEVKDFTNPGTVLKKTTLQGTIVIGQSGEIDLGEDVTSGDKLLIVPKILGETDAGTVAHLCTDNFGYALTVA